MEKKPLRLKTSLENSQGGIKKKFSSLKRKIKKKNHSPESWTSHFFKIFIFVVLISGFIFISTVGLHEFGHVLSAKYYNCEYKTILFEEDSYPYTEIFCPNSEFKKFIIWAGPLLPSLLAISLFIIGGKFIREIALMMLGFNLLTTYKDLLDLGFSPYLRIGTIVLGLILIAIGLIFLNHERFKLSLMVPFSKSD
ncbi:M50 family metallopeptidase [Patescibacteria group bacterium]|nr:M50 family metallopeptidase [Patescibacteria group bacterium]